MAATGHARVGKQQLSRCYSNILGRRMCHYRLLHYRIDVRVLSSTMDPTLAQVTPAPLVADVPMVIPAALAVVQSLEGFTGKTWPQIAEALDKDNRVGIRASVDAAAVAELVRVLIVTGVIQ
jgi:hypothetical protein